VDPTCGRCPACKHLVQAEAAGRLGRRARPAWPLTAGPSSRHDLPFGEQAAAVASAAGPVLVEDEAGRLSGGYVEPGDPGWTRLRERLARGREADVPGPAAHDDQGAGGGSR